MKQQERNAEQNARKSMRMLTASMVSMVLCVLLFVGTTWAWFTDSNSSVVTPIQSGQWTVEVLIINQAQEVTTQNNPNPVKSIALLPNEVYTIQINPIRKGNTKGYCYITFGGQTYYTTQMQNDSFLFTVDTKGATAPSTLTIVSKWGSLAPEGTWSPILMGDTLRATAEESTTTPTPTQKPQAKPPKKTKETTTVVPTTQQMEQTTTEPTTNPTEPTSVPESTTLVSNPK